MEGDNNSLDPDKLAVRELLRDSLAESNRSSKRKDCIIILLSIIILILVGCNIYSEYAYEYVDTVTTSETTTVDMDASGDSASASYAEGDQYNDNATHNEDGDN